VAAGFGPIAGLKIGHAQDDRALTGCTVLLADAGPALYDAGLGMVAGCDVRGGAVGERELETLRPGHVVERIHALVLAGGSAFGLDAAAGVMRWCEERGIGFDTGVARIPIVPAAILFDLRIGEASTSFPRLRSGQAGQAGQPRGRGTPMPQWATLPLELRRKRKPMRR
jgi:L-aminopeptidase/D-esterase-like protein